MKNHLILQSTGAIGDAVILTGVQKSLADLGYKVGVMSAPFTLSLWNGIGESYAPGAPLPTGAQVVPINNYLRHFPHTQIFPGTKERAHLSQWMGYEAQILGGLESIAVSRDNVRIVLDENEIAAARDRVYNLSSANDGKPIVVIAPYSNTKNRNLPLSTLDAIVQGLEGDAVIAMLEPVPESGYIKGTIKLGDKNLRNVAGLLLAAHAYIGVDSGPLHIAAGAIQGAPQDVAKRLEVFTDPGKIIVALASSSPQVVAYSGNQFVFSNGGCIIAPCGAHGYVAPEEYGSLFSLPFVESGVDKDKSGCTIQSYPREETAACMASIDPEEIIEKVKNQLRK